jgi:hypothetical protein
MTRGLFMCSVRISCFFRQRTWISALLIFRLFFVTASSAQSKQAAEPKATKQQLQLFGNGWFQELHGFFLLEGDRLHVYRALPTHLNPTTRKFEPSPEDNELKPLWKGEPYYHETYKLEDGEWVPKMWGVPNSPDRREFSQSPQRYLDFGACDTNDEIDLPNPQIRRALWPAIKIKKITEFQGYAAVVFSGPPRPENGRRYGPSDRSLHVAFLVRGRRSWLATEGRSIVAITSKYFCGTRTLFSPRGEETRPVLLIFSRHGQYDQLDSYVVE